MEPAFFLYRFAPTAAQVRGRRLRRFLVIAAAAAGVA